MRISQKHGYSTKEKPARKGHHPTTGQEIDIPAKKSIKIKVGKEFTDKVNH